MPPIFRYGGIIINQTFRTLTPAVRIMAYFVCEMDKGDRTAKQHVRQVRTIWKEVHIGPELKLKDLLSDQRVKEMWLQPFLQTCSPGTAKSYLGSLRLFFNFTMATHRNEALSRTNNTCTALKRLSSIL
jgi:hypothetical protein